MPRFSPKALYRWTLAALLDTAVAIPLLVFVYAVSDVPSWPEALPGAWLLLLTFSLAAAWELGAPPEARGQGTGRLWAMAIGLTAIYLITFYTTPELYRGRSPLGLNLAMAYLPVAGYLWYQGAASAAEGVVYGRVYSRFGMQCLVTVGGVILLIVSRAASDVRVQALLYWSVLLLVASGLALLVVTREQALRQDQARLGEKGAGGERMSGLMTGVVGGLVLMTLLASQFLSVERTLAFFALVGGGLARPVNWIIDVAMLITLRWVMLILGLFNGLMNYFIPKGTIIEQPEGDSGPPAFPPEQELIPVAPVEATDWMPYVKIGLLILGAIILVVQLLRLRRRQSTSDVDPDEERVDLGLWQGLKADLQSLLASLRSSASDDDAANPALTTCDDPKDPRALYRRLQKWGSEIGRPRRAAETPARYEQVLEERRPEATEVAALVTELYQQARYGPTAPDPEAVERAAEALKGLRQ